MKIVAKATKTKKLLTLSLRIKNCSLLFKYKFCERFEIKEVIIHAFRFRKVIFLNAKVKHFNSYCFSIIRINECTSRVRAYCFESIGQITDNHRQGKLLRFANWQSPSFNNRWKNKGVDF